MSETLHKDELSIDGDLVRSLIREALPAYKDLPLVAFGATGSSNRIFALGDELLVRLPRQEGGGATLEKEHRLLPLLQGALAVEVPEMIFLGDPGFGYPERWCVMRKLEGERVHAFDVDAAEKEDRRGLAEGFADVILALRAFQLPNPDERDPALRNYRGGRLKDYDGAMRRTVETCRASARFDLDFDLVLTVWEDALRLPRSGERPGKAWYHGDLVAENLLIREGRLSGVLDFGGVGIGNSVIDLHGVWELFGAADRDWLRRRLDVSDEDWLIGRAWALAIAIGALSYYGATMPERCHDRLVMARAVLADAV